MKMTVVVQEWEESEKGWGIRPDGYSFHLSMEDRDTFVKAHGEQLYKTYGPVAPYEYSRVSGNPFLKDMEVGEEVLARMTVRKGWRSYARKIPTGLCAVCELGI